MPVEGVNFGDVTASELERMVVISPHLDDAVLGSAHLLATYPGTTVVTVFAGRPSAYPAVPTPWDALGGFSADDDVAARRRVEDEAALTLLGATPLWLDFVDHQYLAPEERSGPAEVAAVLQEKLVDLGPTSVFLPMGLANPDHVVTHDAGLLVRAGLLESGRRCGWFCYEDSGYKHIPGLLAWRVSRLFRSGLWPTPAVVPVDPDAPMKSRAIACYASQLPPLRREHALEERLSSNVPEQYWRLAPPPDGWEGLVDV